MSDIQKEIKEALKESEGISLSNFHQATREQGKAHDKVRNNAHTWLPHLLELIEQKDAEIERLKARLIYYQDLTSDPTAEELHEENKRLREEIKKLREIQRALVLTPMQKMSRAMEIIDKQKGADTCAP